MAESRYTPNPLRPYYIPPSIGREQQPLPNIANTSKSQSSTSFAFPDLDYSDYIPDASPSITGTVKTVLDKALWKYTSVLMAQPFEVAKLILQVRLAQDNDADSSIPQTPNSKYRELYEEPDSEDEEPNYFTSSAPFSPSLSERTPPRGRTGRPKPESRSSQERQRSSSPHTLQFKNAHSLMEVLSSLSSTEGPFAIWKATNSTFIYNIMHRTLETFLRSFLAAIVGVADTEILLQTSSSLPDTQILNSAAPLATVLIATFSSALSALVLSPIDTSRTRLILTSTSSTPRSLLGTLKTLNPMWLIPSHLIPITFLTSSIPTLISTSTPFVLKQYLSLDPVMNPTSWSMFTFLGSALDLSIKFPLETVLRRAQIATWTSPTIASTHSVQYRQLKRTNKKSPSPRSQAALLKTIVPVSTSYPGILSTMYSIVRDEGFSESQKDKTAHLMRGAPRKQRRGQGVEGLYRGWRVGLWGLVGIWATSFVGGLQGGAESVNVDEGVGAGVGRGAHGGKF